MVQGQGVKRGKPPGRGRPKATSEGLDREVARLGAKGLGAESIAKALQARGITVSERTVARRLAVKRR